MSNRAAERAGPAIVSQRIFQFSLAASERRRVVKMLDTFGAIRLNNDKLEAAATRGDTRLASNEAALPFVKPNHLRSSLSEGMFSLA